MTTTSLVPGQYPVALNGVPYLIDESEGEFRHISIPALKPQQDVGDQTHEGSVNPDNFWRSSQQSWHRGMGQRWYDRGDSDPYRYDYSLGIDPWTKYQLKVLPQTDQKKSSTETNLYLAVAGDYLYLTDGAKVYRTQHIFFDNPTWSSVNGEPATNASSITSDGYNIWTAHGVNGVYLTTRGAASMSSWATGTVNVVRYVNGRLMAAAGNSLYNLTTSGALPSALLTHANTDFTWVDMAAGSTHIYAAGYAGDKSFIYKTAIKPDGTSLDVPSVAGQLPDGEVVRSIFGYLGFILIGTDTGVRFAAADGDGNLTIGALIATNFNGVVLDETQGSTYAVRSFAARGQYVWFGWPSMLDFYSGLGRMDLTEFTSSLTPAYATDEYSDQTGAVLSVVEYHGRLVFTISGHGVWGPYPGSDAIYYYAQAAQIVGSRISYDLQDLKTAHQFQVQFGEAAQTSSSVAAAVITTSGSTNIGTYSGAGRTYNFDVGNMQADYFAPVLTFTQLSGWSVSASVLRWTLLSDVVVNATYRIIAPLQINESDDVGFDRPRDVAAELATLKAARAARTKLEYQEGTTTYNVILEDYEWKPDHKSLGASGGWNGTFIAHLKVIP